MKEWRSRFGRTAYAVVLAGLAGGVGLELVHLPAAPTVLAVTCGVLVALPVINVLFVIADEIRRRDWVFASLAVAVLALLAATLIQRAFL
jgi:hypothetical protein